MRFHFTDEDVRKAQENIREVLGRGISYATEQGAIVAQTRTLAALGVLAWDMFANRSPESVPEPSVKEQIEKAQRWVLDLLKSQPRTRHDLIRLMPDVDATTIKNVLLLMADKQWVVVSTASLPATKEQAGGLYEMWAITELGKYAWDML